MAWQFHIKYLAQVLVQVAYDITDDFLSFLSLLVAESFRKIRQSRLSSEHPRIVHFLDALVQLLSIVNLSLESLIVAEDRVAHYSDTLRAFFMLRAELNRRELQSLA